MDLAVGQRQDVQAGWGRSGLRDDEGDALAARGDGGGHDVGDARRDPADERDCIGMGKM